MKKIEFVYREILYHVIEKENRILTQSFLSKKLKISLSTVNHALNPLRKMNAITVKQRNFKIVQPKKILYYWSSIRNLDKDIIYQTYVNMPIREIEAAMPDGIIYAAYSAYKFRFKDVPADYSEIYLYSDLNLLEEVKKRFPLNGKKPNLFVLKKYGEERYGKITTIAQTFVDLWNIKEWYAAEFLKYLEERINGILE
jgi:DNA-binding transcriptional regulator YhcF (GntR family)